MALQDRSEAEEKLCWDLGTIFASKEEALSAAGQLIRMAEQIEEAYEGRLSDAGAAEACLEQYERYQILAGRLVSYGELLLAVDFTDDVSLYVADRLQKVHAECQARLAFVELEIGDLSEDVLQKMSEEHPRFAGLFRRLRKDRGHRLQKETESLIRKMQPLAELPYSVYNAQKMEDLRFEDFAVDGKSYPLGYSLYEDYYEYHEDTAIRRAAGEAFYRQLAGCKNVTATAYRGLVTMEKGISQMRGFEDVFSYLLDRQEISKEIYDAHLDILMESLAPHMRRYAELLKKARGLDRMTCLDLKAPFRTGQAPHIDVETGRAYIREALSVMGTDYTDVVDRVYRERRIDFAQNAGKSTGAFCESVYGCGPYILCNWQGQTADLFTVAHELGHAVHFEAMQDNCSKFDFDLSMYLIEAPSTFNELLLADWLRERHGADEKSAAAALLGNTFYHNFVTHFLEGYFQREVYRSIERGESISAESLSAMYRSVLERFWGETVELSPGCELTWMRQPHYYSGLYSYTYSASLSVATAVWRRMKAAPEETIKRWKRFLRIGRTKSPAEAAKELEIDIASGEHVRLAIEAIGGLVDALEA